MYVLAETINSLAKQIVSLSTEVSTFKWALEIIVGVVAAYGIGSGLTLLKISDNQVKKIEKDLSMEFNNKYQRLEKEVKQIPTKWVEDDVTKAMVTFNGWNKDKNSYLKTIHISNLTVWKLRVILHNDDYVNGLSDEILALPINVPFEGIYPSYVKETQQWVTVVIDQNKRVRLRGFNNHSEKVTLSFDMTSTDAYN